MNTVRRPSVDVLHRTQQVDRSPSPPSDGEGWGRRRQSALPARKVQVDRSLRVHFRLGAGRAIEIAATTAKPPFGGCAPALKCTRPLLAAREATHENQARHGDEKRPGP